VLQPGHRDEATRSEEITIDLHHRRVLAVFAHPDDAELTCFGTLAMLRSLSAEITILILTNGERSSSRSLAMRREEAVEAAKLIQGNVLFANLPDGGVSYDGKAISEIEGYLRKTTPDIVITHFPLTTGFGHQDHERTAHLVTNATLRASAPPWLMYAEPAVNVVEFQPNLFVDVTPYFPLKLKALACHRCEENKPVVRSPLVEVRASWWAQQARGDATTSDRYEAFHLVRGIMSLGRAGVTEHD
jgi:N-acetylglucosamine malate deacetylase 1